MAPIYATVGLPMTKLPNENFKAYDNRGIVDKSLKETVTGQIGQALWNGAKVEGGRRVVIDRVRRKSGRSLATDL